MVDSGDVPGMKFLPVFLMIILGTNKWMAQKGCLYICFGIDGNNERESYSAWIWMWQMWQMPSCSHPGKEVNVLFIAGYGSLMLELITTERGSTFGV
jgi:hypothetical protein